MKRYYFIILILSLWFLIVLPHFLYAGELEDIIQNLQKSYEATKTISADFTQESLISSIKKKQQAIGTVVIKKPGKMRWIYEKPEKQVIISNSKGIYVYIPEEKQVIKEESGDIFNSSAPLAFLSGNAKLKDTFNITSGEDFKGEGVYKLILKPNTAQPNMDRLILVVNAKNFNIEKASIYDLYGNITTIEFKNIVINEKKSDDIFDFKIPEGVEVLER